MDFRAPAIPVFANVDAIPRTTAEEWKHLLASQLCSPVQWRQTLYALDQNGASTYVELGPGAVLSGMAKRTIKGCSTLSVQSPTDVDMLLTTLTDTAQTSPATGALPADGHGESLYVTERLVVSPAAGLFTPNPDLTESSHLNVGDVVGLGFR